MKWNLNDHLSTDDQRRFSLPLSSTLPDGSGSMATDRSLFSLSESYQESGDDTTDVEFSVLISEPDGGFTDDGSLPNPSIRVHTMDRGRVFYEPATSGGSGRLVMECWTFATGAPTTVPWWGRWVEAGAIPWKIIYENVDTSYLASTVLTDPGAHGLAFPVEVVEPVDRLNYVQAFLGGDEGHFMWAASGACLGRADTARGPGASQSDRELIIKARYADHTAETPWPMNPRELFALLFGDDSSEATSHPLLLRLDEIAATQTSQPETTRMLLRPPLRTWKRLMWECDLENTHHQEAWARSETLGEDRFYNDLVRDDTYRGTTHTLSFNDGNYTNRWKCNLFVCDLALRAGYRAGIHHVAYRNSSGTVTGRGWHFIDAGGHAAKGQGHTLVDSEGRVSEDIPVGGHGGAAGNEALTLLSHREGLLLSTPVDDRADAINRLTRTEGRCMVLAGSRGGRSGHIVFVKDATDRIVLRSDGEVTGDLDITVDEGIIAPDHDVTITVTDGEQPFESGTVSVNGDDVATTDDQGAVTVSIPDENTVTISVSGDGKTGTLTADLHRIGDGIELFGLETYESKGVLDSDPSTSDERGAVSRTTTFQRGGSASRADEVRGFDHIHLLEFEPGRDPDLSQGLQNLNIE